MTQNANTAPIDQTNLVKLSSKFRTWVHNLWIDNCEERQRYNESKLEKTEYWNRFKWWLRREYRHRQKIEKERYERQQRLY